MAASARTLVPLCLLAALSVAWAAAAPADTSLDVFRARYGRLWRLDRDAASGRPRRLTGGAFPLLADDLLDPARREEADAELTSLALGFLRDNATLLGLDRETLEALRPSPAGVVHTDGGRLRFLHLDVAPGGVPVLGARVLMAVSRGRLIYLHLTSAAVPTVDLRPEIAPSSALKHALDAAGLDLRDLVSRRDPELAILPTGQAGRLVWLVDLTGGPQRRRTRVLLDAGTGETLSVTDETLESCDPPPPTGAWKRVLGGVRPERADEAERVELLPLASLEDGTAAGFDGYFAPPPGLYAGVLEGPLARIECAECSAPASPLAPAGADGDVDFGTGGADASGNGLSTPSDRTAYFHAVRAQFRAGRWLDLPWLAAPLPVRTNVPSACNAFWNGVGLNFFRSSPSCANTGEVRDVVLHEWGHGLDDNDGLPPSPTALDAATGEAVGDIVALLGGRDSCIGESFHKLSSGFPSDGCSGVRDLDERAPGHEHGSPATLTTANVSLKCSPSLNYRGPLGGEGHCEGEVLGQAFWHLVRDLLDGVSYGNGSPLPDGPLPEEEAWRVAEEIFFASRPIMASYAPSGFQSIGPSAYDAFLVADDEGDGIGNGTPHAAAIHDAFVHHGIAEAGPAPPDTDGCTPPPSPVLTAQTVVPAVSGLPAVQLTWTDVGAAGYRVLRADGLGEAFHPLAAEFGPGRTDYTDLGVLPARPYLYLVEAAAADGCIATSGAPVTGSAGPLLRVAGVVVDDSASVDPDGVLEAGEEADLLVDLENTGSSDATAARVTLSSPEPALAVTAPGPLDYGDIPAGGSAPAPGPFHVRADAGVPRYVVLSLEVEAAEGCLRAEHRLETGVVDLVLSGQDLSEATGDLDGKWEPGEEADLEVRLRDEGLLDAVDVTGVLSFRGGPVPGITLVRDTSSWGTLPGKGPEGAGAPPFRLAADPGLGPRTKVPLSLEVRLGGSVHRTFDLSVTVGGFPQGMHEWSARNCTGIPLVLQLDDDDGDGAITRCDVPDVILPGYPSFQRMLAVSGDSGAPLWELVDPCASVDAFSAIAGGDLDGDGVNEVVTVDPDRRLCAVGADGSVEWVSDVRLDDFDGKVAPAPQVWDLDGDTTVEVIADRRVFHGADGSLIWEGATRGLGRVVVGDLDLDGFLEVNAGNATYRWDGTIYPAAFNAFLFPAALGDLDGDGYPERVDVGGGGTTGSVRARDHLGNLLWSRGDIPDHAHGAPCLADIDGDGRAEIGVASPTRLYLLDDDGSTKWSLPTDDSSRAAGCSFFDFEGDGVPEIVYRDQANLYVVDATDGEVLWMTPVFSGTAFEYPVIADVDGDGSAEILISGSVSGSSDGFHVFGNPAWSSARGVWNQEDYSVNHVTETGAIVPQPFPRWLGANDFRTQAVVCPCAGPTVAPQATLPSCPPESPDSGPGFDPTVCFESGIEGGREPIEVTWTFGDGSPPSSGREPCHAYPGAGTYAARLRIRDRDGCVQESGLLVRLWEPPVADFEPTTACVGEEACLTADVTGGAPLLRFSWELGDGTVSSEPSPCHTYASAGTVRAALSVVDANGCASETFHDLVVADPAALPEASASGAAVPLRVAREPDGVRLRLTWQDTGLETGIYTGRFDLLSTSGYNHRASGACRITDAAATVLMPAAPKTYFLAVTAACSSPRAEGPYGSASDGTPRPAASDLGLPACP